MAANLPWLASRQPAQNHERVEATLSELRAEITKLRSVNVHPTSIDEDVHSLPVLQPKRNIFGMTVTGGTLLASILSKTLGVVSMVPMLLSSGGSVIPYMERYNTTARTRELVEKGYRLLLTKDVVAGLRTFQFSKGILAGTNIPSLVGKDTLTGAEILSLAKQFDKYMSPPGELAHWMETLVRREFHVSGPYLNKPFTARRLTLSTAGGMMGGAGNSYYGITQFSEATWEWVAGFARKQGIDLPTRLKASFIEQIIAAYIYGILNQSIIRPYVKGELTADHLYIAHNQGGGVFITKRIRKDFYAIQSAEVRALIRNKFGFVIV